MKLVADIGATNARFRLVSEGNWYGDVLILETAAYASEREMMAAVLQGLSAPRVDESQWNGLLDAAVLAVAGPPDPRTSAAIGSTRP